MPRRGADVVQLPLPPKKKAKIILEETPSLDVSFCDDEALPPGIVFTDVQQKKWRIGKPIGRGSFGRIYLVSDEVDKEVTKQNARYVVKIEPHSNGPLFVEVHCLIRTAQVSKVRQWRIQNKQKNLGMPVYIASGSFTEETTGVKYRFLVLPRYDIDLQKIIARTKVLDIKNVLVLALHILDVLEFIHNQGYTHSDIKSSNLMLGFDGGGINKLPTTKITQSFQKETKEVTVLSGKQRKAKTAKSRGSNYYDDEDFVINNFKDDEAGKKLTTVKNKLRKFLSDKDSRHLHRHHAFNLRQISNNINYEDMNSSVCSDQSYQRLLDDFGNRNLIRTSEDFLKDIKQKSQSKIEFDDKLNEIYKEAVLSQCNGQIYLLDYGLASKFLDSEGNHKDFGMDARKAHDGTLEYSSRDSHIGAHSRRSDLETLGYNLLDWLTGTLPWKTTEVLAEPDLVHALKKNFMGDIKLLLKTCFKSEFYPHFMEKYLEYITSLEFVEKPDYNYCRSVFKSELLKTGYPADKELMLNFAEPTISPMSRNKLLHSKRFGKKNTPADFLARNGIKKTYERENVCSLENDLKLELLKQTLNSSSDGIRKPCTSRNFFISDADLVARLKKSLMPHDVLGKKLSPKNLRSNKRNIKKRKNVRRHRNSIGKFGNFMGSARQFTWAEILAGNPEDIIRKERKEAKSDDDDEIDDDTCKYRIRKLSNASSDSNLDTQSPLIQKDYLQGLNPTYAMKEVIANFKKRLAGKCTQVEDKTGLEGYTPAMIKIYRLREAREKQEALNAKSVAQILPRRTRSMKKKEPVRSSSNKTTGSEDSTESETDNTTKKNDKIKSKFRNSIANKKDVKIVIEMIKPAVKPVKKTPQKRSSAPTPNNRRRLRSSKRTRN